ncbi:MAG: four helix bundle protein [Endomicrobiia bacterium]
MATYKSFEDLPIWKNAKDLSVEIYKITSSSVFKNDYGLSDQIRRSSISISSNIAEGFERATKKEFIQFLFIAKGSVGELRSQVTIACELGYITLEKFQEINKKCLSLSKQISGFISYLRQNGLMKKVVTMILICNLQFVICNLNAAFQDYGWSVRAEGMGGVFTAVSNDASGIIYNPSGIGYVTQKSVELMYTKPYLGLEGIDFGVMYFSGVLPLKKFSLGINYNMYSINNLYFENVGILSSATGLKKFNSNLADVMFGLNLKYLTKRYSFDEEFKKLEPTVPESKSVLSVDFGSMYKPVEKLSFGLMVRDINSPNVAVIEGNKDIVPMTVRVGSFYNFGDIKSFEDFSIGFDVAYRMQDWGESSEKLSYAIGLETYFSFHTYALRVGVSKNSINFGGGYFKQLSDSFALQINYAVGVSTVYNENFSSHKLSLEFRF